MQPHPPASELECVKWRFIVFTCENGYQLLCVDFVNKDENQVLDDERVPPSSGPSHNDVVPAFGQIYNLPERRQGSIDSRAANGTCQIE